MSLRLLITFVALLTNLCRRFDHGSRRFRFVTFLTLAAHYERWESRDKTVALLLAHVRTQVVCCLQDIRRY